MIFSFYSYKGGVGRSMALANVAYLFYRAGFRVLMVDSDLEAPGLERFFASDGIQDGINTELMCKPGLIDLIYTYKGHIRNSAPAIIEKLYGPQSLLASQNKFDNMGRRQWNHPVLSDYIHDVFREDIGTDRRSRLLFMPAGRRDDMVGYSRRVREFDWDDFFNRYAGTNFFEWLRLSLDSFADIVLIDSRTGIGEVSGMCVYHLADVVTMFCAPNDQNLDGTTDFFKELVDPQVEDIRKRPLHVVVVPSRIEDHAEMEQLADFESRFTQKLNNAQPSSSVRQGTIRICGWEERIPYVPEYALREKVAVQEMTEVDREDVRLLGKGLRLADAYARLANTLAELAAPDPTLMGKSIIEEEAPVYRVFLHYDEFDKDWGDLLAERIEMITGRDTVCRGVGQACDDEYDGGSYNVFEKLRKVMNRGTNIIPLVSRRYLLTNSLWSPIEWRWRLAVHGLVHIKDATPSVVPIYIDDAEKYDILQSYQTSYRLCKPADFFIDVADLVDNVARSLDTKPAALPEGITDTRSMSDEDIRKKLDDVKRQKLKWDETTGSARKWWEAFEEENKMRLNLVLRLAEELAKRHPPASITEFFLSYVYSNTDNIQANLFYLDYTRAKKDEERKRREVAQVLQDENPQPKTQSAEPTTIEK